MIYSLINGDELPEIITGEFLNLASKINGIVQEEHDTSTGEHTDISVDSISAKSGSTITLNDGIRLLNGPLFIDPLGNNTHIAGLRPPSLTANTNDYSPAGLDTAIMLELESTGAINLTGIVTARQKRFLWLGNRGSFNITLKHNVTSTSQYRFGLPGSADYVLASNDYVCLYYDVGSEIWRLVGMPSSVTVTTNNDKTGYTLTAGSYSSVDSVQRGSITITSGSGSGSGSISTVSTGRASVSLLGWTNSAGNGVGVAITGLNPTSVPAVQGNSIGADTTVYYEVWEEF